MIFILLLINSENFETIMCQFGNMFKKVLYLSDDGEVSDLTNSINVNGRMYLLHEMLYIAGYDEFATELKDMNAVLDDILDDDMLEDQQMIRENFIINTAEKTTETISKLLYSTSKVTNDVNGPAGIFLLRYKYTHSLNKFLFYPDTSNTDSVKLLIVPSMSDEATRLPRTYSNLHILVPKSYNTTGSYYTATMEFMENKWSVSTIIDNKVITESLLESP